MAELEHPRVTLSEGHVRLLEQRLKQLHAEAGAECAFISDLDGTMVTRVGMTVGFDLDTLALFVSKWFHAAGEVGWYLGDRTAFDLSYHDGAWYDLYAANIGNSLFLTLLFTKTTQISKIGMVWVLTRRAVKELQALAESKVVAPPKPPEVELPPPEPAKLPHVPEPAPEPVRMELDELERMLLEAADEGDDAAFEGLSYEQAKAMGLLGASNDRKPSDRKK
jgi:hypothetical protein